MIYLILAVVAAAIAITIVSVRQRPTADPSKSVDSFQKALDALDPGTRPKRGRR